MEVCSSTEMGAPGASHLGTGDHGPKTDRSRPRSVPVNALVLTNPINSRLVGNSYLIGIMVSIPHAHASCDSAVTCPYIGQKNLTAVVFKALFHVQLFRRDRHG